MTTAAPTASAVPAHAPADLDPAVQTLIEGERVGHPQRLRGRFLSSALFLGGSFLAVAVALGATLHSDRGFSVPMALALVAIYALASHVEFEVRTGYALPTQLVLVPMLFLLPLGWTPLLVCAGLVAARSIDVVRGRALPDRLLLAPVYSWHVFGPVVVLALAGEREPRIGDWPIYAAALVAQFVVDFAVSAGRDWVVRGVAPNTQLPFMGWAFVVDAGLAPIGFLAALAGAHHRWTFVLVLPLIGLLAQFAHERRIRNDHALELSHAYRGTAFLLGDVVEADDAYTGSHSRDVVSLVLAVCDRLGLSARDRRDAEFAALLHDVGKIKVPSEIINKPGPLTPEERAIVELHTVEGERLLARVGGILGEVGRVVRSCHEDWDGTGYPDRLAGEEIPLAARIVRCCDAFSAMTTDRPYRHARPAAEAVAELRQCAGTDFDPRVVEALAATLDAR
jgi:HD-GYP domain-containing protein (c-di-GMP phosphodiesterase class II)